MPARRDEALRRWMRRPWLPGVIAVLLIALLAAAPRAVAGPLHDRLSNLLFDQYQRWAPRSYEDAGVKIVDIDEESIRRLGQWPWPRSELARLNRRLAEAGAAAIAYDVVFSESDRTSPRRLALGPDLSPNIRRALSALPDGDDLFAASLAASPSVLGVFLTEEGGGPLPPPKAGFALSGGAPDSLAGFARMIAPIPSLDAAAKGRGFVTIVPDSDAIVRRPPLVARVGGSMAPALAVEALRVAQGAGSIVVKSDSGSGELGGTGDMVALKVGQFEIPTARDGSMWVYFTAPQPSRTIPAWQILSDDVDAATLSQAVGGQIVFVGAGAVGLRDLVATPMQDRDLGVSVHAQMAEQAILGVFLHRPDWGGGLEILLLLVLGLGLAIVVPRIGALGGAVLGGIAIFLLFALSWAAFVQLRFLLDPTWPALAVAVAWLVQTVLAFYREERQRAYIHRAFDRYLSPEMVKRIADDPSVLALGGSEREMSVLFCDIRSFSRISEAMAPDQVIDFLVRFLTPMSDLLLDHQATIDKYIGDAILAFWNAPLDDPDHYRHAAEAALAMQRRLAALNMEMADRRDVTWPGDIRIGIGLNAGRCCVGNIGSERRLSYSLIGDPVNLASRLEGLTKYYGVPILCGEELARHLDGFAHVAVDRVRVVGRDHPETIFALVGDAEVRSKTAFTRFAERQAGFLNRYFAADFDSARPILDGLESDASAFGLAGWVERFHDRLHRFAADPPTKDWDGVFEAESK